MISLAEVKKQTFQGLHISEEERFGHQGWQIEALKDENMPRGCSKNSKDIS